MKFRIQVKGLVVFIVIVLAMRTTVAGNPLDTSEYGLNPELAAKLGNSVLSVIEDNPPADRKIDVLVSCDMDLEPDYISEVKRRTPNLAVEEVWENLGAFRTTASPNMILKLTEISFVKRVDKNTDISPCLDTAREETDVDWWTSEMPDFQGDKDGNKTFYSRDDIVIAVLDTGIDTGHKDLDEGKVIAWKDIWGERRDWAEEEPNPVDENGHGTHCASIAAGTGDSISDYRGVAPHAALVGVRVLGPFGGRDSDVMAGFDWVAQNHYTHGIEIVTCSFCSADEEEWGEYDVVAQSADILVESYGLVMCVSAGNYGPDSGTVSPPGTAKWAITVGWGTDPWHGGWSLHPNSSRGPCEDGRIKPDILAPGTDIRAAEAGTTDSHIEMSGTSMATPFVAGMAALWLDRDYSLRYAVSDYHEHPRVKKLLMASAHDMPEDQTPGLDDDYGAGRVSASKQHGFYTDDISSYKDDAPTVLSYSWLEQSYNHNNEPLWVYDPEDGEDWYRVQCYSGLFIAVSADGDPDLILRVRIWNKYSQIVASSYPGNYRSIGHWAQYSGEYYIQVVVEEYSGDYYDIDIMTTPS